MSEFQPGDLIATRSSSFQGEAIRVVAALQDLPNLVNHIIIAHHVDKAGVFWGIEGRPGGVGWVSNIERFLDAPYSLNNIAEEKTPTQRAIIARGATKLLGTPYDWVGIVGDGLDAAHIPNPWDHLWTEGKPSHVVCSSAADYLYEKAKLETPEKDQNCTPGDWARLWLEKNWTVRKTS